MSCILNLTIYQTYMPKFRLKFLSDNLAFFLLFVTEKMKYSSFMKFLKCLPLFSRPKNFLYLGSLETYCILGNISSHRKYIRCFPQDTEKKITIWWLCNDKAFEDFFSNLEVYFSTFEKENMLILL